LHKEEISDVHVEVKAITCAHRERAVTKGFHQVDSGAAVHVDLASGTVRTNSHADAASLAEAIRAEGCQVQLIAA
jgi:copper chaperone